MKALQTVNKSRRGFTLVELIVVVLVLGIVAAVAAPKMFDTAGEARQSSSTASLSVLRNAIQLHLANIGDYPGDAGDESDLKADLQPFLQGPFPINQHADAAGDGTVRIQTTGAALSASGDQDWAYDNTTGEIILNTSGFDTL